MLMQKPKIRGTGSEIDFAAGPRGDQFITQMIPSLAPLVAAKRVFVAKEASTTTCATAMPTTTSGLAMQNPMGSGRIYVVLAVFGENDVNAASEESFGIAHCPQKLAAAAMTRDITIINSYLCGSGAHDSLAILDAGATVVDDGWTVIGSESAENSKASAAWGQLYVPLPVPVVIVPGGSYGLEAISTSATTEVALGIVWAELDVGSF